MGKKIIAAAIFAYVAYLILPDVQLSRSDTFITIAFLFGTGLAAAEAIEERVTGFGRKRTEACRRAKTGRNLTKGKASTGRRKDAGKDSRTSNGKDTQDAWTVGRMKNVEF